MTTILALRIEEFPNYFIRDDGNVWSTKTGRFLRTNTSNSGYLFVTLGSGTTKIRPRPLYVHRLVAESFLGKGKGRTVNHKDGNKLNNELTNLEWLSPYDQVTHAISLGLIKRGAEHALSKQTSELTETARSLREAGLSFSQIGELLGLGKDTVRRWISDNYSPTRRNYRKETTK